jgi:hypothetical protein
MPLLFEETPGAEGLYFKSDKDPMQVRCEGGQEEEPEPARTRAVAASGADAVDLSGAAPRVIKVKDQPPPCPC